MLARIGLAPVNVLRARRVYPLSPRLSSPQRDPLQYHTSKTIMTELRRSTRSSVRKRAASPVQKVEEETVKRKKTTQRGSKAKAETEEAADTAPATTAKSEQGNGTESKSGGRRYWLMKAEPESRIEKGKDVKFSIDDLAAMKEPAGWDGVRNYAARNHMKAMKKGDIAFFYHSNCKEPGIAGTMEIVREASVDETAFDPKEPYYDPKSDPNNPKWYLVHVEFREKFRRLISLQELKKFKDKELKDMPLLKQGRLSVSPVPDDCYCFIRNHEKLLHGDSPADGTN